MAGGAIQYWVRFGCGTIRTIGNTRRYYTHGWLVRRAGPGGEGIPHYAGFAGSADLARKAARTHSASLGTALHSSEVLPVNAT